MKVKIKTWEDMENEFGLDNEFGSINCEYFFTEEMEEILPEDRIILINSDRTVMFIGEKGYWLSEDMVETYLD